MTALIELQNVTKVFGQGDAAFQALRGIDLVIQPGEFVAVMGPSGSGKSTAMNILGCLDVVSSGGYFFQGMPVHTMTRQQHALLRRYALGFIFQGFNLLARTSALENVELPLLYRGDSAKVRQSKAMAALEQVGLSQWAKHTPAELSGGQQQRVAIARALASEPLVLFADEPTGNLDSQRSHEIISLLQDLNAQRGITIVMVTHEVDIARRAKRIVTFKDGALELDRLVEPV